MHTFSWSFEPDWSWISVLDRCYHSLLNFSAIGRRIPIVAHHELSLSRKKHVRAGHRGSTTKLIGRADDLLFR